MDIKKLLQDVQMISSPPGNFDQIEGQQQVSYEYHLKNSLPIQVDKYMGEADHFQVQNSYQGDFELWMNQYENMAQVEIQTNLNAISPEGLSEAFLGYKVMRVQFHGSDPKNVSLSVKIYAIYEIPFVQISQNLAKGLSQVGK